MAERAFALEKLVTDRKYRLMQAAGHEVVGEVLKAGALEEALVAKVAEEKAELEAARTPAERTRELHDYVCAHQVLMNVRAHGKRAQLGEFQERMFVHTVLVPEEDEKMIRYYESQPEKYPEVTNGCYS